MIETSYTPPVGDGIKIVNTNDIGKLVDLNNPQVITKPNLASLYTSIATPSVINTVSVGMTYIQDWFYSKIKKDFFRTTFVDGEDAITAFKKFNINKDFKKVKPILSIKSQYNLGFNRDMVDTYLYGIEHYIHCMWNRTFLNDVVNNMFLSFTAELFEITYNFSIIVGTRAMQIDLYKYMQMAYRQNSTQGEFVDMDMICPYDLMTKMATDLGFKITNGVVEDIISFLGYLNKHSMLTFTYKYRGLTGRPEFYIRVPDVYMHISNLEEISIDDGESVGQTKDNFGIDMTVTLRMPSPKFFVYFCKHKTETVYPTSNPDGDAYITGIYTIQKPNLNKVNDKGWILTLSTEWVYERKDVKKDGTIDIDFAPLLTNTYIWDVIKYNNKVYISSGVFLDFQLLCNGEKLEWDMDWYTLVMKVKFPENKIMDNNIFIAIYVNNTYVNETKILIKNINGNRIEASPERFQG